MDLQMPGMDGVETTARIREMDTNSHRTPIIALTAHALADEQEALAKQGFDGYMAKPISSAELTTIIRDYTGYDCGNRDTQAHFSEIRDTRQPLRPSSRRAQQDCVSVSESIQLAAGKADLAEELFSMLLEQLYPDMRKIRDFWAENDMDSLLDCVHKLHGATRYCGVPELRAAANQLETALKCPDPDTEAHKDHLLDAMERLQAWSEQTDWQPLFRQHRYQTGTAP